MNNELRIKLSKILELIERGATEGEKEAAKKALDRLVKKYNITPEALEEVHCRWFYFKYTSVLELFLIERIIKFFTEATTGYRRSINDKRQRVKEVGVNITYADWVTVECAYEYFRRHMKAEWQKVSATMLKACRKAKTRNKTREALQEPFIQSYIIKSGLYKESELTTVTHKGKAAGLRNMMDDYVEGGQFHKQVASNLLLEN